MGIKKSGIINNTRNNRSLSISNVLNKSSVCVPTLNGGKLTNSTVLLNPNAESFIPISQKHVTYPVCKVSSPRYYGSSLPQNHANDIFIDINQKQCANSYSSLIPPYCTYELNPCADIFVPHKSKMNVNCKIIAVIAISFILSILIIYTIYINGKHDSTENSPQDIIRQLKLDNHHKIVIGHLNINCVRNKFQGLRYLIEENIDILLLSETKLDDTFPDGQFFIDGFHAPYREDRTKKGGGLLLYIREHIPCKKINVNFVQRLRR